MGKTTKCSDLNLNDSGSLFFWGLIILLFLLVIGNFILTLMIISFFKIGMGMESIKLVPEMKTIKFYGSIDFNKIYKKDGLIESFRDSPAVIEGEFCNQALKLELLQSSHSFSADDTFIKFNLIDRKGSITNRFLMGSNGTEFKGINSMSIKDPDTNLPIFASTKLKYNMEKPTRNLEATVVYASELVSSVDKKLDIQSINMFVRGIEGTTIDGKEILVSAEQNIFLKSSNGTITMNALNGIYIGIDKIAIAPDLHFSQTHNDLQYKLCVCFPKGVLYRVQLAKLPGIDDPCRHFDRHRFNPCL